MVALLTGDIETNIDAILQNALNLNSTIDHQFAQNGEVRADILTVKTTVAEVDQAMADLTTQVQAQIGDVTAALEDKLTAVVDASGASAIYTLKRFQTVQHTQDHPGVASQRH